MPCVSNRLPTPAPRAFGATNSISRRLAVAPMKAMSVLLSTATVRCSTAAKACGTYFLMFCISASYRKACVARTDCSQMSINVCSNASSRLCMSCIFIVVLVVERRNEPIQPPDCRCLRWYRRHSHPTFAESCRHLVCYKTIIPHFRAFGRLFASVDGKKNAISGC